jgi:hypothetical protein
MKTFSHISKKLLLEKAIYLLLAFFLLFAVATESKAQETTDKMVATVGDGVRTELITYSDLLWQLALEPSVELVAPRSADLSDALRIVTDQRIIALEAERLPAIAPSETEVKDEIRRVLAAFPSPAVFEARLRQVGFDSTDDPNFRRIIEQRVAIEKYLDFRFRSFVVITPAAEEQFYKETFVPRFRQQNPNVVVPALDDKIRDRINQELTEIKIAADIESFLEESRTRAIIATLNPI